MKPRRLHRLTSFSMKAVSFLSAGMSGAVKWEGREERMVGPMRKRNDRRDTGLKACGPATWSGDAIVPTPCVSRGDGAPAPWVVLASWNVAVVSDVPAGCP